MVLSGTGTDGTRGVRDVREAGGLVIVQSPSSSRFDGMPRSAIAAGVADLVIEPEAMAERLAKYARSGVLDRALGVALDGPEPDEHDNTVRRILRLLEDDQGVNFAGYKQNTIVRRIARRMAVNHVQELSDYLVLTQTSSNERDSLYRDLLIGVTRFFRDRPTWDVMQKDIIRPLVAATERGAPLRVWTPGCSSGEEPYTMAMIIADEMHNQGKALDVKIFATDLDKRGIEKASRGVYDATLTTDIDHDRVSRYFVAHGNSYEVDRSIRSMVMFAQHNVTRDPPFTKLDIVSCRNLLIYFDNPMQQAAIGAFHFGLKPGGVLLLGSSETIGEHANHFASVDAKARIFRSIGERSIGSGVSGSFDRVHPRRTPVPRGQTEQSTAHTAALALLAAQYSPSALLINHRFEIMHVFGDAGEFLSMRSGSAQFGALDMTSPELAQLLAAAVPQALRTGTTTVFQPVGVGTDVQKAVRVLALAGSDVLSGYCLVVFEDERNLDRNEELVLIDASSSAQLASLHRELELSRTDQQILVERFETANEELQATNEELLASNEELQSVNEELQSVNEELHTVNAEFQEKAREQQQTSNDLDALLSATNIGALFLDSGLRIRKFTPVVTEFLPLVAHDLGRPIADLSTTVGGQALIEDVQTVLSSGKAIQRSIESQSGPVLVRVLPYQLRDVTGVVVTFTDVVEVKRQYEIARRVLDALPAQVAFIGSDGVIRLVNREWELFAEENGGSGNLSGVGTNYFAVCEGSDEGEQVRQGIMDVLDGKVSSFALEYPCHTPLQERWFTVRCTATPDRSEAVVVHFDMTAQKSAEVMLAELATHDHLTGVLNRRGFDQQLRIEQNRLDRSGLTASALLIDCDNFKQINESVGLVGGDAVLSSLAQRIQRTLRPGDTLARVGGDEFVVLVPEVRAAEADLVAERIRLAVSSSAIAVSHHDINLTVSIAIATLDAQTRTLENVLERSRFALETSKSEGKNRTTRAGAADELTANDRSQQHLADLVADADALTVVAQPIINLTTNATVGYEMLTRISGPLAGLGPLTMFQLAQENGLLTVVDERCLRGCVAVANTLPAGSWRNVNVYPSTLLQLERAALEEIFAGVTPGEFCIEISEQQILGDASYLLERVQQLRALGLRIAIDDVGFGRTALESLIILEPEVVKIDQSHVHGVGSDPQRQRWLQRLVRAAKSLNAELIAEGIEDNDDSKVLQDLGVTFGQGYLYGRPAALVDVTSSSPLLVLP